VLLHDRQQDCRGRTVERGGLHEIGTKATLQRESLRLYYARHKSNYSHGKTITAKISEVLASCRCCWIYVMVQRIWWQIQWLPSYNKWGRPNPPYVVFKYNGKDWQRVSLTELPDEIKTPNLIFPCRTLRWKNPANDLCLWK